AEDQVGSVASEVALTGIVLRLEEAVRSLLLFGEQRPVRVLGVLVGVAEQELTDGDEVRVLERVACGVAAALPIELGLADAVDEAERLVAAEIGRGEHRDLLESLVP